MSKKLTIVFVREQFERERYVLVSSEYINSWTPLEYICPKGDIGTITWNSWQQGSRCSYCSGSKKLTIEFVKNSFKKEGYTLLTKKYMNCYQKLEYICPKGDVCNITWLNWQKGKRCRKCWYRKNRGENSSRWNPNLTDEDRQDRRLTFDHNQWSSSIKERDNFMCQVCGQIGYRLVSHHLYSYHSNRNLRTLLSNGICLCEKCHNLFHKIYGRKNNTKEQFEEFRMSVVNLA